jgi:4-amino-4-deoxy-L-arabinose transferase-like glycosyltransferase
MRLVTKTAAGPLLLLLVAAAFCAPLFLHLGVRDQENDEAIYSYAVESVIETGDWMNPRSSPYPNTVFLEKPPLKFWLVALPIKLGLLPDNDLGLRFLDAVFGSLAFLYVFAFGRRLGGWVCGVAALLLLYTFDALLFEHGLRGNNMEAAMVLTYAGGVYHFLRWSEAPAGRKSWAHAAGVGAWFFLGFMCKFVAALFLPVIFAGAFLELPALRAKVLREWRVWLAVSAIVLLLIAPWFVYQSLQPAHSVWTTMFKEHVVARFTSAMEEGHRKPWNFYFRTLWRSLVDHRTAWVTLAGALLIHLRVVRERWVPGTLTLYWFWAPFVLMSLGTSKLWHYAYPFLPPVALAGGYLAARAGAVVNGRPDPANPSGPLTTAVSRGLSRLGVAAGRVLRLSSAGASRIAAAWAHAAPAAVAALLLLSTAHLPDVRQLTARMAAEPHPIRSTRDCIAAVQHEQLAAHRPVPGLVAFVPSGFMHSYFSYFRKVGWEERLQLPEDQLKAIVSRAAARPVLISHDFFRSFGWTPAPPAYATVSELMVVVLPGPYARCAF